MISIYKRKVSDESIKRIYRPEEGVWVVAIEPTEVEVEKLAEDWEVDDGHLRDAIDPYEVPRMEIEESGTYIFTRVPIQEGKTIYTVPILLLLFKKGLMTISVEPLSFIDKLIKKDHDLYTEDHITLFLKVLGESISAYNALLTTIRKKVRLISSDLENISNTEITQFIYFENILNDFLSALLPTQAIIATIASGKIITLSEEEKEEAEDLSLSYGQVVEATKSTLKTIVNTREAASTIMTNNLNKVIKRLTSLTIVLTIPTMIASFFGMNVQVPLADHPLGFFFIAAITILLAGGLLYIFNKKDWF